MPSTIHIINVIILSIFLILPSNPVQAANLSIEIGRDSTSVAAGRDFSFGYGMVGIAATFMTDAPWSYVATTATLDNPCQIFQADVTKDCQPRGRFQDGDEWELFGKVGYRLPLISRVYLNTGLGVSKQKSAELYLFSEEYCTYRNTGGGCDKKTEYGETWGEVDKDYYMTLLGGISVEMSRRILFNLDYHSRKGLIGGLIWRY